MRRINHPWILGIAGVALVLLLWTGVSNSGLVDRLFLPTPQAVWTAAQGQWSSGMLVRDSLASIQRVVGSLGRSSAARASSTAADCGSP